MAGGNLVSAESMESLPAVWQVLDSLPERRRAIARRFTVPNLQYEHPDLGDDPQPDPHAEHDLMLCRLIGERLQYWYPGHPWAVEVEHRGGVAKIGIPALMGSLAWYVIHLTTIWSDPSLKCVREAGGHILERYRLPRNRYDYFDFAAACAKSSYFDRRRGVVPE